MKITKLHLKDFKVFDDLELVFTDKDQQPLNQIVLAGLNGTGKTTILEVIKSKIIESKSELLNKTSINLEDNGRNVEMGNFFSMQNNSNKEVIYSPAKIRNEKIRKELSFAEGRFSVKEISYEIKSSKSGIRSDPETGDLWGDPDPEFIFYNRDKMKEVILKPLLSKVLKQENKLTKAAKDYEVKEINSAFKGIDINSKFIGFDPDNLFFESANGQRIIFEELSSGEKQLYFMGFMLKNLNINNTIIMIDEPEDSLHPKWQRQLLQFYSNIGENNQVILATHSPHIIGSAKAESVFLLKNENGKITASNPKYSEGHSIPYVLSEIMDVDYRNTYANNLVDDYLTLIRKGEHTNEQGKMLLEKIEALNLAPNSEEQQRIDLSLRRFEAIGR